MSVHSTRSQSVSPSIIKRSLINHALVAYFVLAFAGSWILFLPVLLARNGVGLFPFTLPVVPFQTISALAGPTLAAIVVTAATSGLAGLRQLLRRIVQWRVGVGWYALALLGYPLIYVGIGIIALGMSSLPTILSQWPLLFTLYLPYLVFNLISTMGEEIGWTGYALPNMQQRITPLLAAVMLGALWGLWHLPSFFVQGSGQSAFSIAAFIFFIVYGMAGRITWSLIFNKSKASVIIMVLLHASVNGTTFALLPRLFPVTPAGAVFLSLGLFVIIIPALIVAFTKGHLAYKPDLFPSPAEVPQPTEASPT